MNRKFLVLFVFLCLFGITVDAQESPDQTIARLKTEVARREAIDRDASTPEELKATNRANLEKARTALLTAVQAKIAALEKYLNTLGGSITTEEKNDARGVLRNLAAEANGSVNGNNGATPNPEPRREPTSPSSVPGAGASSVAVVPQAVKIVSPDDKFETDSTEVEVVAQIDDDAPADLKLKATVTSQTEVTTKEFVIAKGRREKEVKLPLSNGENTIKIEFASDPAVNASITVSSTATTADDRKTPFTRAIFGIEQAAAASAKTEQKLFLEFNLTAPLFGEKNKPLSAPVWLWLNPRITSLPKQLSGTVAEFATAANFTAPFTGGNVNDIAQGFEFLGGVEVKASPIWGAIPSGFGNDTKTRFGLSFVVAAGMSTPFGSQQVGPQFFKVNDTVEAAFPGAKNHEFIAFVNADRNRFFRQYYAGLRLKSYFVKDKKPDELDNVFPGIIDLTFGQNESVTGGGLFGGIARIDGIYPLPFIRGKYKGSIYVFGSALMKLSKPKVPGPIILQPPSANPEFPSDKVFIQQVPPRDADHYRLGVGVDLIRLLKP